MLTQQELNLQERHLALLERIAKSLENLLAIAREEQSPNCGRNLKEED